MKLKNNALQELYDTLVSAGVSMFSYADSPVYKAFKECDEKLSESVTFEEIKFLQNRNNVLERSITTLLNNNKILVEDLADAKVRLHFLTRSRDDWKRRVEHAEDEVEDLKESLKKRLNNLYGVNSDKYIQRLQDDRDFYHGLYTEHRRDYDKLFEENKQIKKELHTAEEARNNLRAELEAKVKRMDEITKDRDIWFRKNGEKQAEIEELKKKIQSLDDDLKSKACSRDAWRTEAERLRKELTENYSNGYSDGKEEGEENLWDALQNVRDVNLLEEFDPECETLGDIIDMDLEDFLDTYQKWQEEKNRLDNMRDYLARFCEGRVCKGCPLESTEYKCGCGYSFRRRDRFDTRIIPDEDIKRYYEKARGCGRYPLKNLANWECTLEANVKVNKDLLEIVCGIKPEEEAHKLEYGDAVRLPWRDYDYMYIGPDEKEESLVRMFDPKNHAIVTSHIANVRYSGCKIIITDEDDLRFIWKDKK